MKDSLANLWWVELKDERAVEIGRVVGKLDDQHVLSMRAHVCDWDALDQLRAEHSVMRLSDFLPNEDGTHRFAFFVNRPAFLRFFDTYRKR